MDSKNMYWEGKGKFQKDYDEFSKLIPIEGSSKNHDIERLRIIVNFYYDGMNNGFINESRVKDFSDFFTESGKSRFEKYVLENDDPKVLEVVTGLTDILSENFEQYFYDDDEEEDNQYTPDMMQRDELFEYVKANKCLDYLIDWALYELKSKMATE